MRILTQLKGYLLFATARTKTYGFLLSGTTGYLKAADRTVEEQRRFVAKSEPRFQGQKPQRNQRDPEALQACCHTPILCGEGQWGKHKETPPVA
jgi:hypothetical protein